MNQETMAHLAAAKKVVAEPTDRSPHHLQVFVLIDALGWKLLEQYDFLSDILPNRMPLRTVLGFSSGAIPSMLTGAMPAQHGHWNLFYYDPEGSPFRWLKRFLFLPKRVLHHRVTSKLLKELGRRALGLGPLFEVFVKPDLLPWFNWVEKKNIYSRGGISGAPSIFDQLAAQGVPHKIYSYHHFKDAEILRRARDDVRSGAANFFFVYLSELDSVLHHNCEPCELLEQRLRWYADSVRNLFEVARKRDPDMTFVVVSDHGMAPVRRRYDLVSRIERLPFSMPDDYLAVYDSTMARFWFFNKNAQREIMASLTGSPCGRILDDVELDELGILFPDRRFGEIVFLLHPGWLLSKSDFNGKGWNPSGMHGYHPDDPHSDAVFLSNRTFGFAMSTIRDVYRCMREAC
jgi:predicted AlkP superfamily pyrophosphatase or phosphodiesterase